MGYGLAFQLFYMVAIWALLLEHGKCQVLSQFIFPLPCLWFGQSEYKKKEIMDYTLLICLA